MIASPQSLEALEYPVLVALVAALARTDLGASRVLATVPTSERSELDDRRTALSELGRLSVDGALSPSLGEPLAPLLARLSGVELPLDGAEILLVARLMLAGAEAARRIEAAEPACPALARRLAGVSDPAPLLARIERVLDGKGRIRDDASPRLVRLARELRGTRERLYARLERLRGDSAELFAEPTVPLRGGRLQLLLSAGARGRIPGLVHGRSASGKSFYFEPLEVVEENNALESAIGEQEAERARLLQELRAGLAAELPLVEALAALIAELDALGAASEFAALVGARLPEIAPPGRLRLRLRGARHPLLDPRLAGLRERVLGTPGHEGAIEPLDLELGMESRPGSSAAPGGERRLLVITGPNAGGKTVALKTLGLLALAAQAGWPVPCEPGSELPLFTSVVATVGDEQDLLAERSTFSGRLLRLAEAWRAASPTSLALLDELGSGTDPEEGAALAIALVERLLTAGGVAIVTTHLAPLAMAALERPGAGCAAMEFDPASGRPTFRLRPGPPGGSEALALARRLGLPAAWIARADELVGHEHRDFRRLMAELEATRTELAQATREAEGRAAGAELERARHERERATLEAERRMVARRSESELRDFRERVSAALAESEKSLRAEFAAGRRRGVAAQATAQLFAAAPSFATESFDEAPAVPIVTGALVHHRGLGWDGAVERIDGERVWVRVAGKRLSAQLDELVARPPLVAPPKSAARRSTEVTSAEEAPAKELLLLGFTVDDALEAIDRYLDHAVRTDCAEVRVVHGHGTGRLREAIRTHLKKHPAVASSRPGAANEGGNGATVVTLR